MNTSIEQFFGAYTSIDDRGSPSELIGLYRKKEDAERAAAGKGYWNSMGPIRPEHVLIVQDGLSELYFLLKRPEPVSIEVNMIDKRAEEKEYLRRRLLERFNTTELASMEALGLVKVNN